LVVDGNPSTSSYRNMIPAELKAGRMLTLAKCQSRRTLKVG